MPKNLTDVDTFTDPVVVPVDADPRNAESVEVPFQALANRTRNLHNRFDPDGEVLFPSAKQPTVQVPMSAFLLDGDPNEYTVDPGGAAIYTTDPSVVRTVPYDGSAKAVDARLTLNRHVPANATITRIRVAAIYDDAGPIHRISMHVQTSGVDWDNWVASGDLNWDIKTPLDEYTGSPARIILDSGVIGIPMLTTSATPGCRELLIEVRGADQKVLQAEITYASPGLTNE